VRYPRLLELLDNAVDPELRRVLHVTDVGGGGRLDLNPAERGGTLSEDGERRSPLAALLASAELVLGLDNGADSVGLGLKEGRERVNRGLLDTRGHLEVRVLRLDDGLVEDRLEVSTVLNYDTYALLDDTADLLGVRDKLGKGTLDNLRSVCLNGGRELLLGGRRGRGRRGRRGGGGRCSARCGSTGCTAGSASSEGGRETSDVLVSRRGGRAERTRRERRLLRDGDVLKTGGDGCVLEIQVLRQIWSTGIRPALWTQKRWNR